MTPRDLIGRTLGHYCIVEKIGEGGMGEVYRARDERLDRDVAIKVLPELVAQDPVRITRFEREAKAVAALSHANILEIFDFDSHEDITFATTELLEGRTLHEHLQIKAAPLLLSEVQSIGVAVANGIGAAHGKGVVHRDIKPSNIFLCSDDRVKILDFGLAAARGLGDSEADSGTLDIPLTRKGEVLGTVGYMSPEQVRGEVVDFRTDIFSLGCVFYEMLTGHRAFKGDTFADTMAAILREDVPPFSDFEIQVPPSFVRAVRRCLEKHPDRRFQSALDLAFALGTSGEICGPNGNSLRGAIGSKRLNSGEEQPSIAVLPFADMSKKKDQDYFCEGMAEEAINSLTKIKGLRVAARTSAFQFKGRSEDVRQIGEALNVSMLLEGSVRTAGNRLRVTAQLISVDDGYQIWSERYDREMDDVFEIQDEITSEIVAALKGKIGDQPEVLARRGTGDVEAYHLYLKGRYFWVNRQKDMMLKALEAYRQAVVKDPSYSLAYAGLCWIHTILGLYGALPPEEAFAEAEDAGKAALGLDPGHNFADVQISEWALGFFFEWDWDRAEGAVERAIEIEPDHVLSHVFRGLLLASRGRYEGAEAEVREAQALDPLSAYANAIAGMVHLSADRTDRAILDLEKALEIDPYNVQALSTLGMAHLRDGNHEQGISLIERVVQITEAMPVWQACLGWALATAGREGEARATSRELIRRSETEYVSPLFVSWVFGALGDKNVTYTWLEKAFEERTPYLAFWRLPVFDSFRADQEFESMLRNAHLL